MSGEHETLDSLVAAVARIPPAEIPTTIGRYRILRKLGAGGMGVVYEAEDPELARKVAIKVLHQRSADGSHANDLRREAQTLARLMHANVISVFDVGFHAGEVYVVMQLVEGVTLDRHLEDRPVAEIVAAFVEAGRGLVAAHAAGIVHRDFKPSNVMVGRDGTIRVSDFGLAYGGGLRAGDPNVVVELTTASPIGTPAYMAPEQFTGGEITQATDQFSFCVALWELLQGERPFGGHTMAELAAAVTGGARREPTKPMPRRVRAALIRGLSPAPTDRFSSMSELLVELTPARRTWVYAGLGGVSIAVVAIVVLRGSSSDACDEVSSRDWTASLVAAATRQSAGDSSAVADFIDRWPTLRGAACRGGPATERQASCLDNAIGKLERALAAPPWSSERWGPLRADIPALDRCSEPDPERRPSVKPIASRHTVGQPATGLALGADGRIAIATPRMIEILLASGAHDTSVASPHLDPGELYRWNSDGLWFLHRASIEILNPKNGATVKNRFLPGDTLSISRDGERSLSVTKGRWEIATIRDRTFSPIDAGDAAGGAAEWSPDDRRIAAIAVTRRGPLILSVLRIIDARSGAAVDTPIRLDHEIVDRIKLAWLDSTRIVVNGRANSESGEGLWVARIDDNGRAVSWEERLPAGVGTAYRVVGVQNQSALGEILTASDKLIKIGSGETSIVSQTIGAVPRGGLELSLDGSRALVVSGRSRGWVRLDTGAFVPVAVPGTGRVAIDRENRLLSIVGSSNHETLVATTPKGTEQLADLAPGHQVRCDPTGTTCVVFATADGATVVRVLGGSSVTFKAEALDIAVAPDGEHIAITGKTLWVGDLRSGKLEYRSTSVARTLACPAGNFEELAAWSKDILYVSVACEEGRSRIVRLAPDQDAVEIYDGPWIGNLAITPDDQVIAIRRTTESQPILIEGL